MSAPRNLSALLLSAAAACSAYAQAQAPPSALSDYVKKPDDSFAWKLAGKTEAPAGTVYDLTMTSQTWHDIKWEHRLQVFVPKGCEPRPTMVLYNTGGNPSTTSSILGLAIAQKVGAPVTFLFGIPNQPLFGGKKEDALIAETFTRYLQTKDPTWPLLFPMVKSLVRAMDALQAFAKQEWKAEVKDFVVTGASKRGWTSWLTAASGDPRVKGIAPMVIDTLNMPAQMVNQVRAFGKPSEQIRDYTERGLTEKIGDSSGLKLWAMIDPWVYREKLTLPKMLIFGTNDPYWPQDALNSYWDDLKGEKHVLYVPNAGHDLRQTDEKGGKETIPNRAVNTLSAFARSEIFDKPMPKLEWKHGDKDGKAELTVKSDTAGKARAWEATSDTRDFRQARWSSVPLESGVGPGVTASFIPAPPGKGFKAFFAEAEFGEGDKRFTLSTQIRILEAK